MSEIICRDLTVCRPAGPALVELLWGGATPEHSPLHREGGQLPSRWGEGWEPSNGVWDAHQCWPACRGSAQHPREEGALLMLLPQGGRVSNGWRMGDELCHQTRGLKDGRLECYQSCLDQDVRLSRFLFPSSRFPPGRAGTSLTSSHSSLPHWLTHSSSSPSLLPSWLFFSAPISSRCSVFPTILFFPQPPLPLLQVFIFLFFLSCVIPPSLPGIPPSLLSFFFIADGLCPHSFPSSVWPSAEWGRVLYQIKLISERFSAATALSCPSTDAVWKDLAQL